MIDGLSTLAIVPARSGSKGIPDKNMTRVGGLSLIARTGQILASIPWIDRRVISTDSERYANEGRACGLDAPFLRPAELSSDTAGAFEVIVHALECCEAIDNRTYDLIVLTEPTSPLRTAEDIASTVRTLLETGADSAFTVSPIDTKCHPNKLFTIVDDRVQFYTAAGKSVTARQQLAALYTRNGLCYCFRRDTILAKKALITERSAPLVIRRPVANIDEAIDVLWAEFLLEEFSDKST
jgi:CMP-N,N'-diacetyllegionaminic acid synthase